MDLTNAFWDYENIRRRQETGIWYFVIAVYVIGTVSQMTVRCFLMVSLIINDLHGHMNIPLI